MHMRRVPNFSSLAYRLFKASGRVIFKDSGILAGAGRFADRDPSGLTGIGYMLYKIAGLWLFPASRKTLLFNAGRKGEVASTEYRAARDASYSFLMDIKFDPHEPASRSRVREIAGQGRDAGGIPIPVKLKIKSVAASGPTIIFDKMNPAPRTLCWGRDSFDLMIAKVVLPRGNYQVEVEALADVPELQGIKVDFDVRIPGKPGI